MNLTVIEKATILGMDLTMYGEKDNPLFLAKDIADRIEYDKSSLNKMINNVDESEKVKFYIDTNGGSQLSWFLTKDGVRAILSNSRKTKAIKFRKEFDFLFYKITPKEAIFGDILIEALNVLDMSVLKQFNVDGYRVDFYIPKFNIAIEYDEQQHYTESNMVKDLKRQKYIEDKLGCKFIRCDYRDGDIKNLMKIVKELI